MDKPINFNETIENAIEKEHTELLDFLEKLKYPQPKAITLIAVVKDQKIYLIDYPYKSYYEEHNNYIKEIGASILSDIILDEKITDMMIKISAPQEAIEIEYEFNNTGDIKDENKAKLTNLFNDHKSGLLNLLDSIIYERKSWDANNVITIEKDLIYFAHYHKSFHMMGKNIFVCFYDVSESPKYNKDKIMASTKLAYKFYFPQIIGSINSKYQHIQLKTAIISILIDSYAHNISAHSLAALKWWIELRHKMLDKRFSVPIDPENKPVLFTPDLSKIDKTKTLETTKKYYAALGLTDSSYDEGYYSLYDYLLFVKSEEFEKLFSFTSKVKLKSKDDKEQELSNFYPRFPVPIDYALFPFFRFLRDKGAFWSGVTRDMAFGGETKSWYKILWEDFSNNPLYLGTIAKSEGISKININLAVKHNGHWHSGNFVTVDLGLIDYETKLIKDKNLEFAYCLEDNQVILDFINNSTYKDYREIFQKAGILRATSTVKDDKLKKWLISLIGKITNLAYQNLNDLRKKGKNNLKIKFDGEAIGIEKIIDLLNLLVTYVFVDYSADDTETCELENLSYINPRDDCSKFTRLGIDYPAYSKFSFVKLGRCFSHFRDILNKEEYEVFLPGGIIGEHALFTIFENTIRNIKHYKTSINQIKWGGLNLWISIEKKPLFSPERNKKILNELFHVSVWLGHQTDLVSENSELTLWEKITKKTLNKIIDINGSPQMGGNSQDKACAAMLFNNRFDSVEDDGMASTIRKNRDREYFPWVHFTTTNSARTYDEKDDHFNYENLKKYYHDENRAAILSNYSEKLNGKRVGYLKKFMFLWHGSDYLILDEKVDLSFENISRFKFLIIPQNSTDKDKLITNARENGVVRILIDDNFERLSDSNVTKENRNIILKKLYLDWLRIWLNSANYTIHLMKTGNRLCDLSTLYDTIYKIEGDETEVQLVVYLSHGGGDESSSCNVRSHGAFWSKYFSEAKSKQPEELKDKSILPYDGNKEYLLLDMIEVLGTKIAIFDDRINERMPVDQTKRKEVFEKQLQLFVSPETNCEDKKPGFFKKELNKLLNIKKNNKENVLPINILVVHLTYIENLGYEEDDINSFIEKELANYFDNGNICKFIFVITTGRGRLSWQGKLKDSYKKQTIFKPVESLLNAIESGVSYNDNFDVKYNLVKAIMGS